MKIYVDIYLIFCGMDSFVLQFLKLQMVCGAVFFFLVEVNKIYYDCLIVLLNYIGLIFFQLNLFYEIQKWIEEEWLK